MEISTSAVSVQPIRPLHCGAAAIQLASLGRSRKRRRAGRKGQISQGGLRPTASTVRRALRSGPTGRGLRRPRPWSVILATATATTTAEGDVGRAAAVFSVKRSAGHYSGPNSNRRGTAALKN